MSVERIAVGGSAANPPHLGHLALLNALVCCNRFDQVIWIPSGSRTDKKYEISVDQRVSMTELTFPNTLRTKPGATLVVKYDIVYGQNIITLKRLKMLKEEYPEAEITWYTGVDSVVPQENFGGKCDIEAWWEGGEELVRDWPFLVLPRVGYPMPDKLPDNFQVLDIELPNIASSQIRQLIREELPFEHLVPSDVAAYIKRFNLYKKGEENG